ncbi:MAG: hypothetical protein ABSD75_07405 [Terriglobales bacterium]
MNFSRLSSCTFLAFMVSVLGVFALAQGETEGPQPALSTALVPRLIRIRGSVRDGAGRPLSVSSGITFTLYNDENSQEAVWQETQTVPLDSAGRFSTLLGMTSDAGLPLEIFAAGQARWLGIRPDGQVEQARILLLSVPYALKAADAEMLGGKPASAFLLANGRFAANQTELRSGLPAANSPLGPPNPNSQLLNWNSNAAFPLTSCASITSDGTATVNQISKFTSACNIENSAIFESGGNVGIGNTAPAGVLDVSGTAFIRGSLSALSGAVMTPTGTATTTQGFISNPMDLEASLYNTTLGRAANYIWRWQAEPVGNDSASTSATLNLLYGVSGDVSETGLSVNNKGILSFASGQTFPGTVTSVGTGAGLSGGPITSNGTISIASAGVTNSMLANSSFTVQTGTGLSGGGTVALGGTITITNTAPGLGGTVTSVGSGTGLSGGPITSSGTISLDTIFTDGRYLKLSGGALTGGLTGTTAGFSGGLTATTGAFSGTLSAAGAMMPETGTATTTQGFISSPMDWQASSFSSKTSSSVTEDFRWQAEPVGNDTSNPSASLNLLFGSNGSSPTETGLSIASNGLITFAAGQTFGGKSGGTVTEVDTGAGLTGGPITSSGTISIPAAGVTNSMLANPSLTVQTGTGLSGGGTVALGGTLTLSSNLSGSPDGIAYFSNSTTLASTAAPTNGQILIGATGKASVLGTITAGQNISIANSPGAITISATGGGAASLPFFVTGGERTGASEAAVKNVTKLWGFLLPYNLTTTKVTYDVASADNTANDYDIGIFDNSGNLVLDIGPNPGTTFAPSKAFQTLPWTQGPTSLMAGRYYLALTSNCTSACAKIEATTAYVSFAINASAGASVNGALPSTLSPPADSWNTGDQPTVVIQ